MVGSQFEKVNWLRVDGMHFAEKHCFKLYMGTLAYFPTLTLWFNRKILWSLVHKKLTGGQPGDLQPHLVLSPPL